MAGRLLIENATCNIASTAKIGFVGHNGTGKSTLFRAILGEISLQTGSISYPKHIKIGTVKQEVETGEASLLDLILQQDTERHELLALADGCTDPDKIAQIYERLADIDAYSAPSRAQIILAGLGFEEAQHHMPAKNFSGGWRMRVALAAALFTNPDFLLLDEPSNYLDLEGVMWLSQYIKRFTGAVILISHDRDLLNNCINQIMHLEHKKITLWTANYDRFVELRAEQANLQQKQAQKQEHHRKHIESFIERFKATASKAKQAQSRMKALAKLSDIEILRDESTAPFHFACFDKALASPLIRLENVQLGYETKTVLRDINLRIDNDDRIALLGANGNGKSTFAKFIAGKLQALEGDYVKAPQLKIAYFDQHHTNTLDPAHTAMEHISHLFPQETEAKLRAMLARIGLGKDKAFTLTKNLSGGEKTRLAMGVAAAMPSHLLILDEPTNHLDIDSRRELIQAINEYRGAIILISHDQYLLDATVDRLWQVNDSSISAYQGTIVEYKKEILHAKKNYDKQSTKVNKSNISVKSRPKNLQKEIEKLNKQLETIGSELATIDITISQDAGYANHSPELQQISIRKELLNKQKQEAEELWLEYSNLVEQEKHH